MARKTSHPTQKTPKRFRKEKNFNCRSWLPQSWQLGIALALGMSNAIASASCTFAQILPDNTLGNEISIPAVNANTTQINGGAARGTNLFHSFDQFNINQGQLVYFTNPAGIQNILSRVTGSNASNILGTLGVGTPGAVGTANLFLINPNGIVFGPNARLDVGGSFVGTTANAIQFTDGSLFSATAPNTNPLPLTVNPSAFFFNQIANQTSSIEVNKGAILSVGSIGNPANLLLVGGNVRVDGGELRGVSGSFVQVGGFTGSGTVPLKFTNNNPGLNLPVNGVTGANVLLTNGALINVGSASGDAGSIVLKGGNLTITGGTRLSTSTFGSGDAGVVLLQGDNVLIDGNSTIFSTLEAGATGKSGGILIQASSIALSNSAKLTSETKGAANAGLVILQASGPISITNGSQIVSTSASGSTGSAGGIGIEAKSILINGGSTQEPTLDTTSSGSGAAGNIILKASDLISLENSLLTSKSTNTSTTDFGSIRLEATQGSVALKNSIISTTNFDVGYAGDISITASDQVSISEKSSIFSRGNFGRIFIGRSDDVNDAKYASFSPRIVTIDNASLNTDNSSVQGGSNIDAGAIVLRANERISLTNGSEITSSTLRQGDAGKVFVETPGGSILLDNTRIFSTVEGGGVGDGGDIKVEANSLVLNNGAQLQTLVRGIPNNTSSLAGDGNAGKVIVNVADSVTINGRNPQGFPSAIFSTIGSGSAGTGGDIEITAKSLYLNNGGLVSVNNQGLGVAGTITIKLREDLLMQNASKLTATTFSGEGGDVKITARDLLVLTRNSDITTQAGSFPGGGNGGNIRIQTQYLFGVPTDDNNIIAQAFNGDGGKIFITAARLYKIDPRDDNFLISNDITASSKGGGINGEVRTNVLDIDPTQGLTNPPTDLIDPSQLIAQRCAARSRTTGQENKFTVTGRGGVRSSPNDTLQNESVITDWVTLDPQIENPATTGNPTSAQHQDSTFVAAQVPKTKAYVEAQGWVIDEKGEIILTAKAPTVTPQNPALIPVDNCNGS